MARRKSTGKPPPFIDDAEYREHMASTMSEGFVLDPPGFERLSPWTYMLTQLISARTNFQWVRDHKGELGDLDGTLEQQAFFVAGIMAYGRCYASAGPGIPTLDAKQVYQGVADDLLVHARMLNLRNTFAAHTDHSELVRLTLAVREEADRILVRHLATSAMPMSEIEGFLRAIARTEHFVFVAINKLLDHLAAKFGKPIDVD